LAGHLSVCRCRLVLCCICARLCDIGTIMAFPALFYYLKLVDLVYLSVLTLLLSYTSLQFPVALVLSGVLVVGYAYLRRVLHMGLPSENNPKGYGTGTGDCVIQ